MENSKLTEEIICSNNIFVENLPSHWDETDMEKVFKGFGNIQRILILRNRKGLSKGKGFINFALESSAQEALRAHAAESSAQLAGTVEEAGQLTFFKSLKLSLAKLQPKPEQALGRCRASSVPSLSPRAVDNSKLSNQQITNSMPLGRTRASTFSVQQAPMAGLANRAQPVGAVLTNQLQMPGIQLVNVGYVWTQQPYNLGYWAAYGLQPSQAHCQPQNSGYVRMGVVNSGYNWQMMGQMGNQMNFLG